MARKPKLGLPLQTLRNAPDALEGRRLRGGVFEIDPAQIVTEGRLDDRLQIEVEGLKNSISNCRIDILYSRYNEKRNPHWRCHCPGFRNRDYDEIYL